MSTNASNTLPRSTRTARRAAALVARSGAFTGQTESGTNTQGETFGSAANPDDAPDLIASYGTNGELGYVKTSDLPATDPGSSTGQRYSIPLYANDGQTVKGEFTIN